MATNPPVGYAPAPQNDFGYRGGEWKESLLIAPFKDIQLCLCSLFCPFIRMGLTVERARLGMTFIAAAILLILLQLTNQIFSGMAVHERLMYGYVSSSSMIFDMISILAFATMLYLFTTWREKMRNLYGIEGNLCLDCLAVSICSCCSIAQEATEADLRELGYLSSCTCSPWPEEARQPLHREVV